MTPCEKLGYKVGDKFEVLNGNNGFEKGQVVTLFKDDGSDTPLFKGVNNRFKHADGAGGAYMTLESEVKPVSQRAVKPISKSKRQLAQLLIEAGVTQFPEGAIWAAQDKAWNQYAKCAMFYRGADKPEVYKGDTTWRPSGDYSFLLDKVEPIVLSTLIPNWHQTVLSRDEFDQIVAETVVPSEPDSDGWIKWNGGECPVESGTSVDIKDANGVEWFAKKAAPQDSYSDASECFWTWECSDANRIVAYRLHKPEQADPQYCESVTPSIPEPTLDQLLQDWRNADDYAQRKQTEADEAAAMRDERWREVQARAGEMSVTVGRCEPETTTLDWNDWVVGDEVECVKTPSGAKCMPGMRGFITRMLNGGVYARFPGAPIDGNDEWYSEFGACYQFIRRP